MYSGEMIKKYQTTRDTLRYYVEEGLLKPKKKQGKYWFEVKDEKDFQSIRELRVLGFSIKAIKEIQYNREVIGCSTKEQWQLNKKIVEKELCHIHEEQMELKKRAHSLQEVLQELSRLLVEDAH